MIWGKYKKIHFVGIGGAGMSGIAEILHNLGFEITGSDIQESEVIDYLRSIGIKIFIGHKPENVNMADVMVISSAIKEDNIEVKTAREMQIPVIKRAEMLAELMRMKYSIAVSGAHGKTTTTSMLGEVLTHAGLDPTVIVGGKVMGAQSGARVGKSNFLVAEADESDMSFLKLFPTVAVITNIDLEHVDTYGNLEHIKQAFVEFANKVPFYGSCIINLDWETNTSILPLIERKKITYGISRQAEIRAEDIKLEGFSSSYSLYIGSKNIGRVHLNVPGIHNVVNSLTAIAVAIELNIPINKVIEGLEHFKGVKRRLEVKGEKNGILVIDDYGHHPTEIITTLNAIKNFWKGRIVVVFQPHRYTRTRDLYEKFGPAFMDSDLVYILPIYPAGERPIEGITHELIYNAVKRAGHKHVKMLNSQEGCLKELKKEIKKGDLLLTQGAGNVYKIGERFLNED